MANDDAPTDDVEKEALNPSELGTKEYWDTLYNRELQNYNEDPEDEGTIWFEESNAETVVLKQLQKLERNGLLHRGRPKRTSNGDGDKSSNQIDPDRAPSRFLDLGTGNGHMLFALLGKAEDDDDESEDDDQRPSWRYNEMVGVDYSLPSIELAQLISSQHSVSAASLRFEQWDILSQPPDPAWLRGGFDIILDKGTFDAISLMPQAENQASRRHRHPCEVYREKVLPLIKPEGFLMVTSCNWTRDELMSWLAPKQCTATENDGRLEFYDEASYPTFTFGGRKGQSVVTVLFRKGRADEDR